MICFYIIFPNSSTISYISQIILLSQKSRETQVVPDNSISIDLFSDNLESINKKQSLNKFEKSIFGSYTSFKLDELLF